MTQWPDDPLTRSPAPSLLWRLGWRSLSVKRPQAALALGALAVGAAVTSLLLNLYAGVRRQMTEEFRAYGPNVVIAPQPREVPGFTALSIIEEASLHPLAKFTRELPGTTAALVLYAVVRVSRERPDPRLPAFENAVAAGVEFGARRPTRPGWLVPGETELPAGGCAAGWHLAARLHVRAGDSLVMRPLGDRGPPVVRPLNCRLATVLTTGASADDQVFLPLGPLQSLVGMNGRISLVELSIPGETAVVEREVRRLAGLLPGLQVRPIRQIVYSEGEVLGTIRWMLLSLTVLILLIIALCVMATLTAIILERRKDLGVMKALGATDARLMWLFVMEGAGLGMAGGVAGFSAGALLARGVAARLLGTELSVDLWTLPLVCGLTVALAALAAQLPARWVLAIQPASVLKGE